MRQILLTASIVLSAAGAASAQVVFPPAPAPAPAPRPPLAPPAAPLVFAAVPPVPAQAPIVTVTPFHSLEFDLTSIQEQAKRAAEEGAKWAAEAVKWEAQNQNFNFNFADAQPFQKGTQVEGLLSQARGYIDRNQYDRALSPLDRVITAKAERVDAAMYWKAYTLYKLARRDEAVATVNQLQKEFPQSPWVRDARALEVEMKQSAGQAVGADATDDDVRLLAMNGLMRSDPEAALSAIEKLLAGGANVRVKERALFVLTQSRSDRARAVIAGVARGNANPDLQRTAIRLLAQSNSPDSIAVLSSLYRPDQSVEIRAAIISSLGQAGHSNTAASNALIAIYKSERDKDLKMQALRHLSDCKTPECRALMVEIIGGGK